VGDFPGTLLLNSISMYFTLEINEDLAEILRTTTELYAQLNAYIEKCKGENIEEYPLKSICAASDSAVNMITSIADVIGHHIAKQALDEEKKVNSNLSNTESNVSK
jgi:hypothetical protein